jgi:cytochrome P450
MNGAHVLPAGPRGYPILGVLPNLRVDPIRTFLDAADRYGDIVHMKAGPYHGFLVTDPAHIRHVLQDNARNYHKSPLYDRLRDNLGNGLLTSEDAFWLRQRRLAQPAFHRERIQAIARNTCSNGGNAWPPPAAPSISSKR